MRLGGVLFFRMIVSKPKAQSLFSVGFFTLILLGIFFVLLGNYVDAQSPAWWYSVLLGFVGMLALALLLRLFLGYRSLRLEGSTLTVHYPFRFSARKFNLQDLESWEEIEIKTWNTTFRQLVLVFPQKKLSLNDQEHSQYESFRKVLRKKAGKKRREQ